MTPNRRWMTFGALLLAAFAVAFAAVPADASEDVAFEADFIEVSGDYYLAIGLQQEFEFSLEVTATAGDQVIEGEIPPMTAFALIKADALAASVYDVTVTVGGISGSCAADPSLADSNRLVRFMDRDGTVLRTCVVADGETPEAPSGDFSGWDPALGPVTEDTDFTAVYDEKENTYSVSVGAVKKSTAVRVTVQLLDGDAVEDGQITINYTYTEEKMSFGKIRVVTYTASMDAADIPGAPKYASMKLDLGTLDHYSQIKTVWAVYTPIGGDDTRSSAIVYQPLTLQNEGKTGEDTI